MYTAVNFFQPAFALLAQIRSNPGSAAAAGQLGHSTETLYFQNRLAQVEWHHTGYVYVCWKNAAPGSAEFRAVFHYVRALLNLTNCKMVLFDQSALQAPAPADLADLTWLTQEWTPAAVRETGYSYRAIVSPPAQQSQQRTELAAGNDAHNALTTQFFAHTEAAVRWLRSIYV